VVAYMGDRGTLVTLDYQGMSVTYRPGSSLIRREEFERLVGLCSYGYVEDLAVQLYAMIVWEYSPIEIVKVVVEREGIEAIRSSIPTNVSRSRIFTDVMIEAMAIPGMTSFVELALLANAARFAPKVDGDGWLVELGTAHGRSALVLARVAQTKGVHFVTIDCSIPSEKALLESRKACVERRESWDVPPEVDKVGFMFMDAGHTLEGVLKDLNAWWPHIVPGGVIAVHDYDSLQYPGVKAAVASLGDPVWQHGHLAVFRKEWE